jgi:ribosome biogenesis protein MAK21
MRPLSEVTNASIDRFVYKNPKKPKPRGASAMQPAAAGLGPGTVRMIRGWRDGLGEDGMVNSEAFWRKEVEDIPASQVSSFISADW